MRRKDDMLWTGVLDEVAEDLIKFFFPRARQLYDMKRGVEFLDKELPEIYPGSYKGLGTRYVDKLVKVYKRGRRSDYIIFHIEVQGKNQRSFNKRMFMYYYRVLDRYGGPVTGLSIFTGPLGRNVPGRYVCREQGSELSYKFNTLCVKDYDEEVLVKSNNAFALVLLIAKSAFLKGEDAEEKLLRRKIFIANLLFQRELSESKTKAILLFLNSYIKLVPEKQHVFAGQLDQVTGKTNTMGMLEVIAEIREMEGLEKGQLQERTRVVKRLLAKKGRSVKEIAAIVGVSVAFVEGVRGRKKRAI
jgi:hypothetical protein